MTKSRFCFTNIFSWSGECLGDVSRFPGPEQLHFTNKSIFGIPT